MKHDFWPNGGCIIAGILVVFLLATVIPGVWWLLTPVPELRIFIWEEYIDPTIYAEFERETGAKVVEDNYSSNEEMRAKLQAGAAEYDLAVPSDYMVALLTSDGLLGALDRGTLKNLGNLGPRFRNPPYDPHGDRAVPYAWGVTGIGYSRKAVDPPPTSWGDLLDPARLEARKGRIAMLNDPREAIGAALLYLGRSPNAREAGSLEAARDLLLRQKPFVAKYDSEGFEDSLAAGELHLVHGWSGEIAHAAAENPDVGFAVPKEGVLIFVDNWVILKSSRNPELAHRFIDFVLRPEIAARIANATGYASANEAARTLIDPALLNGPAYALPEDAPVWWLEDLGIDAEKYERIWTELKSGS